MNTNQEIINFLNEYKGNYQFLSPYHENKKMLPFNIIGRTYDDAFPISVDTVEYKGKRCRKISDAYKIEFIVEKIKSGFLIKH
jgi:hypothetical protein